MTGIKITHDNDYFAGIYGVFTDDKPKTKKERKIKNLKPQSLKSQMDFTIHTDFKIIGFS